MPNLASNSEAAKLWTTAKKCLASGDVHGGYAAFSAAGRVLEEQVKIYVNRNDSKYLWRATTIEAKQVRDELQRMSSYFKESHYATLALPVTASLKEVKKAYRNLARKYHPDKNRDTNELFILIKTSYDVLSDTKSKSQYDRSLRAREVAREHANARSRAMSGIGNPRGMNRTAKSDVDKTKKHKDVQVHIAKELKRAWKFVKMQQAQFEAAKEKDKMRRYAQEKAEEKARARAEARRLSAQRKKDNAPPTNVKDVASDINSIRERVMNKLYGAAPSGKSVKENIGETTSYEGSSEFFGKIFGENKNTTAIPKKKMTAKRDDARPKIARVHDDGIRVRAGTDTSNRDSYQNKAKKKNSTLHEDINSTKSAPRIFDDGIRVRPMEEDPYEKIEKSRSKKSVFSSHVKAKVVKDASSKNRSSATSQYDNTKTKSNDSMSNKKYEENVVFDTVPKSVSSKVPIPTAPKPSKSEKNTNPETKYDASSKKKSVDQKLFKYSVVKNKQKSFQTKKTKDRTTLPPVKSAKSTNEKKNSHLNHSEKDFVEEVRRMWRDAVTEAVGLGTDAKFLRRIVEKEKSEEAARQMKRTQQNETRTDATIPSNVHHTIRNKEMSGASFECKKCGKNVLVANVLDHTQSCKKNNVSQPQQEIRSEIGDDEDMAVSNKNLERTNFAVESETFPCKKCGNEIRLKDAIDHASTCVANVDISSRVSKNTSAQFWGPKTIREGKSDTSSNPRESADEGYDSFSQDEYDSSSSGDPDDDDDPLLDNRNVGVFWGEFHQPEAVEPSGFFSADGIFHSSPTGRTTAQGESELQRVLKEIPISKGTKMPMTFVQF